MERIALFGPPGSGKSSIARELAAQAGWLKVEASEAIVFPLAALDELPDGREVMDYLRNALKEERPRVERERAMATFARLRDAYSPDFIARALHEIYTDGPTHDRIVFSGLRGFENAVYCSTHGDLVVYVRAAKDELVARLCRGRGYSREQAIAELDREQSLYGTHGIERIAGLVIDSSTMDPAGACREVLLARERRSRS